MDWTMDSSKKYLENRYNDRGLEIECNHLWKPFVEPLTEQCITCKRYLVKEHQATCDRCNNSKCRYCLVKYEQYELAHLEEIIKPKKLSLQEQVRKLKDKCEILEETNAQLIYRIKDLEKQLGQQNRPNKGIVIEEPILEDIEL